MAVLRETLFEPSRASVATPLDDGKLAITLLYASHGARIHRFLRDLLGDAALAADATQGTFARAYRGLTESRGVPEAPWLFGIARNVSLEMRRARGRAERVLQPDRGEDGCANGSPEHDLLAREALSVVARAMGKLSEERRAMLLLRLDHGLAYEDIARLMECSLAKVKVEIFRAREVLRATMAEYEGGSR